MKIFNAKNYGSIPHLPGSHLTVGDYTLNDGQAKILTVKTRDKHDTVFVHEKLDGSNVGVYRKDDIFHPVSRSGNMCVNSPLEQHRIFYEWVKDNCGLFLFLEDGERLVGEWLAQAHGTKYKINNNPFVAFDIMRGSTRLPQSELDARMPIEIPRSRLLHSGSAIAVDAADKLLGEYGHHGAIEMAEGVVYRVERKGTVDFLGKYVRAGVEPGKYLKMDPPIWNWHPRMIG